MFSVILFMLSAIPIFPPSFLWLAIRLPNHCLSGLLFIKRFYFFLYLTISFYIYINPVINFRLFIGMHAFSNGVNCLGCFILYSPKHFIYLFSSFYLLGQAFFMLGPEFLKHRFKIPYPELPSFG